MNGSNFEHSHFTALKCGHTINIISGELFQECVPHQQANFTKWSLILIAILLSVFSIHSSFKTRMYGKSYCYLHWLV